MIDANLAELGAVILGMAGLMAWVLWNSEFVELPEEIETVEEVGALAAYAVNVASVSGRRMVEFILVSSDEDRDLEVRTYLTASQARLLSDWIATSAAPGRTLADARRRTGAKTSTR